MRRFGDFGCAEGPETPVDGGSGGDFNPHLLHPESFRDAETTILIKFAFWRGPTLGEEENYGKLPQNAIFPGKFHDNKIWKLCEFYCQKILLSFGRLLVFRDVQGACESLCPITESPKSVGNVFSDYS